MRWSQGLSTALGVVAAATAVTAFAAPAQAVSRNVGTVAGVESRCNSSVYLMCLYYNSGRATAYWGTSTSVSDLAGRTFFNGTGAGDNDPVKNNAAGVSCDMTTTSICYVFDRSSYAGDVDFLYGQRSGVLVNTYNDNASVRLSQGA